EIDDTLAEAHVSFANALKFYDWDWPGAERELKRAIELNPNYAIGRQIYAAYLSAMGRHREAIAEAKRAQELDPLSPQITEMVGRCYLYARQFDQAIEQDRKALEIDSSFRLAHGFLGRAYAEKGMYREALAEAKEVTLPTDALPMAGLPLTGYLYAKMGRTDEAQQVLERLISISKQRYVSSCNMVTIYFALGKKDEGFAWLEQAIEERDGRLLCFNVNPWLDNVRSDPRFAEVVRRLRLPP